VPDQSKVENEPEEQVREDAREEVREPWPEEAEPPSRGERARSYFHEHPASLVALLLVLVIVIAAGAYVWHYYSVRESTDDAQVDGHIVPVAARVSGTVVSVNVVDNQQVTPGTVLVQLDPKDYQVALDRAKADLANAEAAARAAHTGVPITTTTSTSGISTAQAGVNAAQRQADAARARVQEAQANYNKVTADLKRADMLIAKDEISRQQYDAYVAAAQAAQATLDASRAMVATAEAQVAQAEANMRSAQTAPQQISVTRSRAAEADAAILRAQAAVQQAELNLQYTTVKAPFDGVVSKRSVELGQVISAGQPLFALVNLDDIYLTANFKETQLHQMCPGQPATIYVDAYGHEYKGRVDSLSGATGARFSLLPPENATGNFVKVVQRVPVKLVFEPGQDPSHLLRPGLSVEPTVLVNQPCSHGTLASPGQQQNPGDQIPGNPPQGSVTETPRSPGAPAAAPGGNRR
jgi:membrane fusion protein (multidrug efflux system)